ncbi:Rab-like protein 3 [Lemmus lemmus]
MTSCVLSLTELKQFCELFPGYITGSSVDVPVRALYPADRDRLSSTGVGKSSLVHLLCHSQVLGNPSWTVGCSVDIRVHDYKEGTPEEKTYYIELWDIGGSVGSASSVKSTRAVFYNSVNGIILVHDLTNKKSSQNLYRWSLEVLNRDLVPTGVLVTNGDYDREQFADNQIPLLVIGTKLDQIHETKRHEVLTRTAFLAEDFNAEEINLDCTNPRSSAAGSSNAVKLSRFFDKVMASIKLFLNLTYDSLNSLQNAVSFCSFAKNCTA